MTSSEWFRVALGAAAVLFGLGCLVYVLRRAVIQPIDLILSEGWKNRSGLNPRTPPGRWRLVGIGCLGLVFLLFGLADSRHTPLFLVLSILPFFVGVKCFARAKRYEARPFSQALAEDKRPKVVYLRSFESDAKAAARIGIAGLHVNTEEGELAEIVNRIGPLVAIGRPGEELPNFGAARVYIGEGNWHRHVLNLLRRAPLVILRAGSTAGLMWEVEQCARRVKPQRLLVLIPLKRHDYDEFRRNVARFFPCPLPDYKGRNTLGHTTLRAILYFDEDWTPHMEPVLRKGYASWFVEKSGDDNVLWKEKSDLRRILENALEPVLNRLSR